MVKISKKDNLSLLENGLEFIITGIDSFINIESEDIVFILKNKKRLDSYNEKKIDNIKIKYSVLHLFAGIELVLKERLTREHWSLIFEKTDKANKQSLDSGDFVSTNFNGIKERLNNIINIKFDFEDLNNLRIERNKIQHYRFTVNKKKNSQLIIKAVFSIISFIANYLEPSKFSKKEKELYIQILSLVTELYSKNPFTLKKVQEIYEEHSISKVKVRCIYCFNNFLIIENKNHCLFCGLQPTNEEIVKAGLNPTYAQ
ncbi:MAG: hypothetical protein PWP52_1015 [Bacteroidales bacterium]|nr:hypothetical protein [Bacteroidales bacterium]